MNKISPTELQSLASQSEFPCISLYMTSEKAGAETRKNPIKFKNLLNQAETKVKELGINPEIIESLAEARSYLEDHNFWQHQATGLAFFINATGIKYYCLERNFSELVIVSDRFYLQPLLAVINDNSQFYLLALAQNQVRLFLGDSEGIKKLELPEGVPASLAEALKYDDPEKQTQYHSGEPGNSPIYHGHGVGTTDNKDEIKRFLQQISNGIKSAFNLENIPLILAGVEYLLSIYREVNSYPSLIAEGITGNPENLSAEKLYQQARSIIQTQLTKERQIALDEYQKLAATSQTSDRLAEIVAAAAKGQVDTLFMVANNQQWGSFDLQSNKVELHDSPNQSSLELYDFAAVNTYLKGGKVYFLDSAQIGDNTSIMAILRYPTHAEIETATV